MREVLACPACKTTGFEPLHRLTIHDTFPEAERSLHRSNNYQRNFILFQHILRRSLQSITVTFHICQDCGLIFFSPRPDANDLAIKYTLLTTSHETEKREAAHAIVDLRSKRSEAIRKRVTPFLPQKRQRALDIGGADGHCLGSFTSEMACGIVDYESRVMWPGVARLGKMITDIPVDTKFDLIMTCHTLEHVDDVCTFIAALRDRLSDKGVLYIEVPCGCYGEIKQTGNLLTHLNFFSKASIYELLASNGLEVLSVTSGPVLSRKRYLPVVTACARRSASTSAGHVAERGYKGTLKEMGHNLDWQVTAANIALVLTHPLAYARAFGNRYWPSRLVPSP